MDNRELKMILSSNGRTLPLGKDMDFDIEEVTGLESAPFVNSWEDLYGIDGDESDGEKLDKRPIHIVASLKDDSLNPSWRKDCIKFFNPKYLGNLYINNMGVERQIDYKLEGWTFGKQVNLWDPLQIIVDLICPDPFMRGLNTEAVKVTKNRKMFSFPYVSLGEATEIEGDMAMRGYKGTIMGYKVPESVVSITNDGDVPTGYTVTLKAARGSVSNPRMVDSASGKRLRMVMDMNEGDTLVITISDRQRTIMLNGENVYMKIDRSSRSFMLNVGENEFSFFADDGFGNLDINMTYSLRYLGV